ncbi:MAG: hypothetical protein AUG80_03460 [Candidatus Rokubacteria bacterium 13_1_20CM_4_68_9]|nr:MAG: hypothetical protein AUG80_03460 [Candidatus Rokubacteria bacterium 13_1_20CM_4_68_9]
MRTLVIVAVVAALLLGCQQSRPANPLAPPMGPAVRTLKEEGDQLARSHDWAGAATKYQTALNRESSNLELRLALGITLSHLDRREETIEQFRWVVNHSQPGTPEFVMARTWLVEAGEVDGGLRTASASPVTDAASASKETTPKGGVRGMTSWPGVAPRERLRLRAVAIDQNVELWDKQVVVEAGKETTLDLSASDSSVSPREFSPAN